MKAVLVGDTLNQTNWGGRATSMAMRALIAEHATISAEIGFTEFLRLLSPWLRHQQLGDLLPGAPFGIASSDGRVGTGAWPRPVLRPLNLLSRVDRRRFVPPSASKLEETWGNWTRDARLSGWVSALHECDVLIVNGEGSIRENSNSGRLHLFAAWAAKRIGKRVAIVNEMVDIRHPAMRELAAIVYPGVDYVTAREHASVEQLRGIAVEPVFAADAAFQHSPISQSAFAETTAKSHYYAVPPNAFPSLSPGNYLTLGASARFKLGPRQPGIPLDRSTIDWYTAFVDAIRERFHLEVVLCGHAAQDHALFSRVSQKTGAPFVGAQTPIPQVVDLLGHSRLYVGGRWHSAILAATGGTKTLLFATNSPIKTAGLSKLVRANASFAGSDALPDHEELVSAIAGELDVDDRTERLALAAELRESSRLNTSFLTS